MTDKILVVDDEETVRKNLEKLLRSDGYEVLTAENGEQGLDIFQKVKDEKQGPIKVALVDIRMPGIDGIEVLKRIKESVPQTEVIVITGHGAIESAIQALRMGAFEYITKPIEYDELALGISRALEKQNIIAERKRAEKQLKNAYGELRDTHVQLVQAGKMAAMGEMAAGVAHELTQPLLGIKGFATAMLEDMKGYLLEQPSTVPGMKARKERAVNDLETILQQTDRMAAIVNNVRDFARASGTKMELLDINQPIENALMLFSEQLRLHNIAIEKNLAQGLPQVMGNSNQLQQVFINLIANARDAIDAKGNTGHLVVSTIVSPADGSVRIEFQDDGIGADEETTSKMFQPFFTTKLAAKGTGLGLSIIARIIEQHGGTIDVQSKVGRGCKFNIRLPVGAGEGDGTVKGKTEKRR